MITRAVPFIFPILLLLGGCASKHALVVIGDHATSKDLRKAHLFTWQKQTHLVNIGFVFGPGEKTSTADLDAEGLVQFEPAMKNQDFRPAAITVGELDFRTPKGQVIPPSVDRNWIESTFQREQSIQLVDDRGQVIAQTDLFLPDVLNLTLTETDDGFSLNWNPDSLNPFGISIWFKAVRGPNTGYPGKLKGFNRTNNVDDRLGRAYLSKDDLPSWLWEDPDHTLLIATAFRRSMQIAPLHGTRERVRVVATQGRQFMLSGPKKND